MFAKIEEFAAYGSVLPTCGSENTEIFCNTEQTGWRMMELLIYDHAVEQMSLHDNTPEGFIPLSGVTVLKVANRDDFSDCKTFLLDRPFVINKSVWHGLAAISENSQVLVVENSKVNLVKKPIEMCGGEL